MFDWFMYLLIALGWYESFYWGTAIFQGTTRPHWRFPRHAFALIVGPILPLVAVAKRIRVVRGPVAKGQLTLAALCSVVWIGLWVTLFHDYMLDSVIVGFVAEHEAFVVSVLASLEGNALWDAFANGLAGPWFETTWRVVLTMYLIMAMPLVPFFAEVYVRLKAHYELQIDPFPFDLRRRGARIEKRPRLFLVKVRGEAGESD